MADLQTTANNEAFIDRIYVIKVPYCLRVTEEQRIYDKLVRGSELSASPCAPATLEMLARFSVLTRLRRHENSTLFAKMRVYDGESLKETDPRARSLQEYKCLGRRRGRYGWRPPPVRVQGAGIDIQPRYDRNRRRSGAHDVRAWSSPFVASSFRPRPRSVTWSSSRASSLRVTPRPSATKSRRPTSNTVPRLRSEPVRPLRVLCRCLWIEDIDFKDPDTGQLMNRELLNQELTKVEKPAGSPTRRTSGTRW